jgi:hypothetical protein
VAQAKDPPTPGVRATPLTFWTTEDRHGLQLEFLLGLDVEVGEIVSMGTGPFGEKRVVSILGGTFDGPLLRGRVVAGGADWQTVRSDGVIEVDARYVIEESNGGRIQVVSQGYRHGPPEVLAALARGETVEGRRYFFRTVMRFETGAPGLDWLNKTIAVATAERLPRRVNLKAWRLL